MTIRRNSTVVARLSSARLARWWFHCAAQTRRESAASERTQTEKQCFC